MFDGECLELRLFFALLTTVALSSSCRGKPITASADARPAASESAPREASRSVIAWELLDDLARCEVDHGGVLIDLGSHSAQGVNGSWPLGADPALLDSERDGETWVKVSSR